MPQAMKPASNQTPKANWRGNNPSRAVAQVEWPGCAVTPVSAPVAWLILGSHTWIMKTILLFTVCSLAAVVSHAAPSSIPLLDRAGRERVIAAAIEAVEKHNKARENELSKPLWKRSGDRQSSLGGFYRSSKAAACPGRLLAQCFHRSERG